MLRPALPVIDSRNQNDGAAQSVQQQAVIVMSRCLQLEQLTVESMRQPSKGMPVGYLCAKEKAQRTVFHVSRFARCDYRSHRRIVKS